MGKWDYYIEYGEEMQGDGAKNAPRVGSVFLCVGSGRGFLEVTKPEWGWVYSGTTVYQVSEPWASETTV